MPIKILDAGCRPSIFAPLIAKDFNCEVYGVNLDRNLIDNLRSIETYKSVTYIQVDITQLRFPDNEFDVVYCVSVLEHLPRDQGIKGIHDMIRVVKPLGVVVITVDYRDLDYFPMARKLSERFKKVLTLIAGGYSISKIRNLVNAPKPYSFRDLAQICSVFQKYIVQAPNDQLKGLSLNRIWAFWRKFYRKGFSYSQRNGRDYTSVGIMFAKSSTVKEYLRKNIYRL